MAGQAEPGRLIAGRYRLRSRLGSGGMGRVWLASDEALRIEVALKEVWLPATPGPDSEERLRRAEREARNAARLRDHPNVVAVHDVVVEDGVPWTVLQLVAGHTLEEHVAEYGPLSVAHAAIVAGALLDALEAAHAAGIVHRDVKPANVMLADDGKVLLTDFGIAIAHADTALTAAGSFLGSVEYIAPERARGTEGLAVSDLFSLGVTLFQAVEGFSPFHRETATGTLTAVILDEAPDPVRAGRLTPVITGLLEKDPGARLRITEARRMLAAPEATPVVETVVAAQVEEVPPSHTPRRPSSTTPHRPGTGTGRRPGSTDQRASGSAGPRNSATGSGRSPMPTPGTAAPRSSATGSGRSPMPAPGTATPRNPSSATGSGRAPGTRPPQGTDQRRRVPAPAPGVGSGPSSAPGPGQRRPTGPHQRPPASAPRPATSIRPRAVILFVLIGATIAAILITILRPASFAVGSVHVGDFVKVDNSGHITGKITQAKAIAETDGRRVTARDNQGDPDVCRKYRALGRPDVESSGKISFCLVRPADQVLAPQG